MRFVTRSIYEVDFFKYQFRLLSCHAFRRNLCTEADTTALQKNIPLPSCQRVGFVGLGNMGKHMATRLLRAGHVLVAYDRDREATSRLCELGAVNATSAAELASQVDVVITMLPSASHVEEVYLGPKGLLAESGALLPWLLIDSSTVDPRTSQMINGSVARCNLHPHSAALGQRSSPTMLDAPVSGGVHGAQAGTLTFMVGGSKWGIGAAEPVLAIMGQRWVHCGPSGAGSAAKLCNNAALAIQMAGVSEALSLGCRLGLDPELLSGIFNSSTARCWSSEVYNPVPGVINSAPASAQYQGGFSSQLMAKDLELAVTVSNDIGGILPLTKRVLEMYKNVCDDGAAKLDFSCIYKYIYEGDGDT